MVAIPEYDERYRVERSTLQERLKDINTSLEDCRIEARVADCLHDGNKLRSELTRRNELLCKKQGAERDLEKATSEWEARAYRRKVASACPRPKRHWWQKL